MLTLKTSIFPLPIIAKEQTSTAVDGESCFPRESGRLQGLVFGTDLLWSVQRKGETEKGGKQTTIQLSGVHFSKTVNLLKYYYT